MRNRIVFFALILSALLLLGCPEGISETRVSQPSITSSNGDLFEGSTEITITGDSGSIIYYTTDGTSPSTTSSQYISPFTITDTKTIKAIATKVGFIDSLENSKTLKLFPVHSFVVGENYSLVIKANGDLLEFGDNTHKQLGTGGVGSLTVPEVVQNNIKYVSASNKVSAYIDSNNDLYMMGTNSTGLMGNGTDNHTVYISPVKIESNIAEVSVGYAHSAIITTNGDLYTSGSNGMGALGVGDEISTVSFQLSPVATNVKHVDVGSDSSNATFYITNDNKLYAMGHNNNGQLGLGNYEDKNTPTLVNIQNALGGYIEIADVSPAHAHTLILTTDGDVYGMGSNIHNSFINTSTNNYTSPKLIMSGVKKIETRAEASFIIDDNDDLYAIGYNYFGMFGIGETGTYLSEYTKLMSDVKDVKAYFNHILVLKTDGTMYAAGDNFKGCFGTSDEIDSKTFVQTLDTFL